MTQMTSKLSLDINKRYACLKIAEIMLDSHYAGKACDLVSACVIEGVSQAKVYDILWYWRQTSLQKHRMGHASKLERDRFAARLIREKLARMVKKWGDTIDQNIFGSFETKGNVLQELL